MYIRDVGFLSFHTHGKSKDEFDQQSFLWLDPVGQMETRSERAIIQNPNHRRQGLKLGTKPPGPKAGIPRFTKDRGGSSASGSISYLMYTMIGS